MRFPFSILASARISTVAALSLAFAGCASVSVTPEPIRPPDPSVAMNAIEAERTYPAQIDVRDFDFAPDAVTENTSVFHQAADLVRSSTPEQRRVAIGRDTAEALSDEIAKRLRKNGFNVTRVASDSDVSLHGNFLLITGRLIDVDEGNRFERVAVGLGSGE